MKPTSTSKAMLFIISKISTMAATIMSSRSVSTKFRTIRTLVLVILPAAGVVANSDASRFGGESFHIVAQFNNASFAGTVAVADNDIWAVGESNPSGTEQPLAVHFNGTSWSVVPTPTLTHGGSFAGVAAAASNDVWAVGSTGSQTLIEHWDGTSWNVVSSPRFSKGGALTAVTAVSSTDAWAVGIRGNLLGDVVEHWDGTSWTLVSSPAFTGASDILRGISADASNDVWAAWPPRRWTARSWRSRCSPRPTPGRRGVRRDARRPTPKRGSRTGTARVGARSPARTRTPQRWDRRDRQLERRHPGELRALAASRCLDAIACQA